MTIPFFDSLTGQYYVAAALLLWPLLRILSRAGLPRAAAALLAVPLFGFVLAAGYLALRRWPRAKAGGAA